LKSTPAQANTASASDLPILHNQKPRKGLFSWAIHLPERVQT
jgi:hypothetical protein